MPRFTSDLRGRFLGLLEAGRTIEDAAATVGVTPRTVRDWANRGRRQQGTAAAVFAERFFDIREGQSADRLTEEDVLRLLELAARKGSVTAMRALLDRFKRAGEQEQASARDPLDELADRRRHAV